MTSRKGQHYMFKKETTSKKSHAELAENAENFALLHDFASLLFFSYFFNENKHERRIWFSHNV